jgi:FtsH-binding integral membrane protein
MSIQQQLRHPSPISTAALLLTGLALCTSLTGCVVVGASSSGGWFIFPGGIGLILMILLVLFLLRRR